MLPKIAETLLRGSSDNKVTIRTDDILKYKKDFLEATFSEIGFHSAGTGFYTIFLYDFSPRSKTRGLVSKKNKRW